MNKRFFKRNITVILFMALFLLLLNYFCLGFAQNGVDSPMAYYGGDDFTEAVRVKTIIENSWVVNNNNKIGMPFGGNAFDFPANLLMNTENFITFIISRFLKDPYIVFNVQYLFSILLCAIIAFYVLTQLSISLPFAIIGAIIYGMSPYIYSRGMEHFCLAACYYIPFSILICLWLLDNDEKYLSFSNGIGEFFKYKKNILLIVFSFLIAGNGIGYYPFFTCFFLLVTCLIGCNETNRFSILKKTIISTGLILIFFLINLLPFFINHAISGGNYGAFRSLEELEKYSLKPIQLFIPTNTHHFDFIISLVRKYNSEAPLINENSSAYLGVFGCIGLLVSFLYSILFKEQKKNYITLFFKLNVFAIVFFAVGGFICLFFIFLGVNFFRGFNRVSIFIEFMCIASLCLFFQNVYDKIKNASKRKRNLFYFLIASFCICCIWEQCPDISQNNLARRQQKEWLANDRIFISKIEDQMNWGDAIFQLPYHSYPESGPARRMNDYQLFAGFLNSQSLRWNYGGVKGKRSDKWNQKLSFVSMDKLIPIIVQSGFRGIYIDSRAYEQEVLIQLCNNIESILKQKPIISDNKVLLFYNLHPYLSEHPELEELFVFDTDYMPLNLGEQILFYGDKNNSLNYVEAGISAAESSFTWTQGKLLRMKMNLRGGETNNKLFVRFELANVLKGKQQVSVTINERKYFDDIVNGSMFEFSFDCPDNGNVDMILKFPDACSPASLGINRDTRELALALKSIIIYSPNKKLDLKGQSEWYYELGRMLSFEKNHGATGNKYAIRGFSGAESSHTWTMGKEAEMEFFLVNSKNDLELAMEYWTFNGIQPVRIYANNQIIADYIANGVENRSFVISKEIIGEDKKLILRFELPRAHSPASLNQSNDTRELALAMKSFVISEK